MVNEHDRLATIANDFHVAWKQGREPAIGKYFARVQRRRRRELARLLIPIDFVQRLKAGEPSCAEDYEQYGLGFGELARELFQELTDQWQRSESQRDTSNEANGTR